MSDQPIDVNNLPALPDYSKLSMATATGQEYNVEGQSIFDYIPESGTRLPRLYAGQSEDKKLIEKQGKQTVYPLDKKLCIEFSEFGESSDSDKPEMVSTYRVLPDTSTLFYPVAVDATRKYWAGAYDPDTLSEPDCQANAAMLRPLPDEQYLLRDANNRIIRGKYSHACMIPDANGRLKEFCPLAQWTDDKPGCVFYIHLFGLVELDGEFVLVEARFKRASFKSGEKALRHIEKLKRTGKPVYQNPIKIAHAIASETKGGYTYYALVQENVLTGDSVPMDKLLEATDTANSFIAASRARADVRNPTVQGVTVESSNAIETDTEDTPF